MKSGQTGTDVFMDIYNLFVEKDPFSIDDITKSNQPEIQYLDIWGY